MKTLPFSRRNAAVRMIRERVEMNKQRYGNEVFLFDEIEQRWFTGAVRWGLITIDDIEIAAGPEVSLLVRTSQHMVR